MEGPVMTSAPSLRSAVSARAQPTLSHFSSSCFDISIRCGSQNSGGCLKKFQCFQKNEAAPFFHRLGVSKKASSFTDNLASCKLFKISNKSFLKYCNTRNQRKNKNFVEETTDNLHDFNLYRRSKIIRKDLFLKLKCNKHSLSSDKLKYPDDTLFKGTFNKKCERVIYGRKFHSNTDSNRNHSHKHNSSHDHIDRNDDVNNNFEYTDICKCTNKKPNNEILDIYKNKRCQSGDTYNFVNRNDFVLEKNIGRTGKSEKSELCRNTCVLDEKKLEDVNGNQSASKWQPKHVVTRKTALSPREAQSPWESAAEASKSILATTVRLLLNDLKLFSSTAKGGMSKYEVFLGGSCNPTTWRTDFAIPELENMNISYYNPQQVEEWKPELLEIEYHAKENATVMFFVIDNQTRGVSSLIEVAHLAGNRRKLILVIQAYSRKTRVICDEEISEKEYEELKMGQEVLRNLVERQRIPLYGDIKTALKATEKILKGFADQDAQPDRAAWENSLNPREVFEKLSTETSREIAIREVCLAVKVLRRQNVSLKNLITSIKNLGRNLNGSQLSDLKLDFDSFLMLLDHFERRNSVSEVLEPPATSGSCGLIYDVYLGGTQENTHWREEIAIPMLMSRKLSYFTPKYGDGKKEFTEVEAVAIESSLVLLFVITDTARSISAMAIAGHYIGKGANVVLCVRNLPNGAKLEHETLTECAIKDYNRGRMYLMDIARRMAVQRESHPNWNDDEDLNS